MPAALIPPTLPALIVDGVPAALPYLRVVLPDKCIGWYQRTRLDCLRAAPATMLQIRYEDVGDVLTLRELEAWAEARGLSVQMHYDGPPDAARWLGFTPVLRPGLRHTIVCSYDRLYFNPASGWVFPAGYRADPVREIEFGVTLEPREDPC